MPPRLRNALRGGGRLVVVGGGFIGLEVAARAVAAGCEVTVLEPAHELMARVVPSSIAHIVQERHAEAGVELRLGVGIESWRRAGKLHRLRLDDGTTLEADLLVAGIGAIPNTELAASTGVRIDNGIAVYRHLRTSDPAIWAAGDCCSVPHPIYDNRRIRLEAWRTALTQSEIVAANLLGADEVFTVVPSFWSDQYELTIQVVGLNGSAAREVVRRRRDGHEIHFGLDNEGRVVSASGVAPGTTLARDIPRAQRLIELRATPPVADLGDPDTDLRRLG